MSDKHLSLLSRESNAVRCGATCASQTKYSDGYFSNTHAFELKSIFFLVLFSLSLKNLHIFTARCVYLQNTHIHTHTVIHNRSVQFIEIGQFEMLSDCYAYVFNIEMCVDNDEK